MKILSTKTTIRIFGTLLSIILLLPSISYAGIIYTRTSIPPDNFSFDISFNDFGTDSGLGAGFTFWGLNMYNIDDVDIYQTESIPTDTTQYVFTIARPNHHIKSIRFYACDMENNCSYEGVTIQDGAPLADAPAISGSRGSFSKVAPTNVLAEESPVTSLSEVKVIPEFLEKILPKATLTNDEATEVINNFVKSNGRNTSTTNIVVPIGLSEGTSIDKGTTTIGQGAEDITDKSDNEISQSINTYITKAIFNIMKIVRSFFVNMQEVF